jgi:glycosyltransferase involved in cell wall biosynthesis
MELKKIIYIAPGLPVGGAEKFLVSLSNSLLNQTSRQIIVSLSDNNPLEKEFDPSIDIIKLPRQSRWSLKPLLALRKCLKKEKPDIIFCLNFFSYIFVRIARLGIASKEKLFISYHSTIHLNKKEHYLHKIFFATLNKNFRILTVSENQARYTSSAYNVPASYFKTILNGVDTGYWKLPTSDMEYAHVRKQLDIPSTSNVIILTAGFRAEKNHFGAINALSILHNDFNEKAYLLFVGDGHLSKEIREHAKASPVAEYVKFAGLQKDVRPYYWSANLFTLCSTSVETFSIAALEAMACGLPAVLTEIGGASEMIEEGKNGFLCQPTDRDIAENWHKALITSFSKSDIHKHIEKYFSLEKMISAYIEVLGTNTLKK